MPDITPVRHPSFDDFVATIAALRAPDGCPWDREQTHASIASNMIEEAYEAVDAIEANDVAHLREELGDVLLQVVLQSQIASDAGEFTIDDVAHDVNAKMIRRHPHVFGDAAAHNANEVLDLWDQVKRAELSQGSQGGQGDSCDSEGASVGSDEMPQPKGLLDSVPVSFPALMQAHKISRKAVSVGFEWDSLEAVWAQVAEEVGELREAYDAAPKDEKGKIDKNADENAYKQAQLEFGDVLFAMVNVARRMGLDSEAALRASCAKFRGRWSWMEQRALSEGRAIEDYTTAELNELWREAKVTE